MTSLKLWLISRPTLAGYDEFEEAVVVAVHADEAMHIHPDGVRKWDPNKQRWFTVLDTPAQERRYDDSLYTWIEPINVRTRFVGIAAPEFKAGDVVCSSMLNG